MKKSLRFYAIFALFLPVSAHADCKLIFDVKDDKGQPVQGCEISRGMGGRPGVLCTTGSDGRCDYTEKNNVSVFNVECGKKSATGYNKFQGCFGSGLFTNTVHVCVGKNCKDSDSSAAGAGNQNATTPAGDTTRTPKQSTGPDTVSGQPPQDKVASPVPQPGVPQTTPTSAPTEISGRIVDEAGEALIGATVKFDGVSGGTGGITDIDGNFKLKVPAGATGVTITYVGFTKQQFPINNVPSKITMGESSTSLEGVTVAACSEESKKKLNATTAIISQKTKQCIPTVCLAGYELGGEEYLTNEDGEFVLDSEGKQILVAAQCISTSGRDCDPMPENATIAKLENGQCVIKKCNEPQYKLENGQCIDQVGRDCSVSDPHATKATYKMENGKLVCSIIQCSEPGWVRNEAATKCEASDGTCDPAQIKAVEHAVAGSLRNGECVITECDKGWRVLEKENKCEQAKLNEAQYDQKIKDLKDNAEKMKAKEQSLENRLLGAAAIGATGIGAMNMMSGMAEQKADDAAEEDMRAYLATFVCDYGQGRNIKGGETNIDLPGGNDLFSQVNEYRTLAADLKARKEALGKTPGIESEIIYDISETGLYDNVGMGRQSGAYASISKALTDETGVDAARWAEQKSDASSKVKTGAITAGIGAVGGLIGNLAINSKNKSKLNEILKKDYAELKDPVKQMEEKINSKPAEYKPCPTNATGEPGNCKCKDENSVYNSSANVCEMCGENAQPNQTADQCVCKEGFTGTPCVAIRPDIVPQCEITEETRSLINVDQITGKCVCNNNALNVPQCDCMPATHTWENGLCKSRNNMPDVEIKDLSADLKADSTFDHGSSTLKSSAYEAVGSFKALFAKWADANPNTPYCIKISGHTDKTGSLELNQRLSQQRANAVKTALTTGTNSVPAANVQAIGKDYQDCTLHGKQESCRKVQIIFEAATCQ